MEGQKHLKIATPAVTHGACPFGIAAIISKEMDQFLLAEATRAMADV